MKKKLPQPVKRGPGRPKLPEAEVKRRAAVKAQQVVERRKKDAARRRAQTRHGQDIGKIPKVVNPKRRAACMKSFALFCKTYFPEIFYLPWSKDLLKVVAKIERVVIDHDKLAVAMPRGSGKTRLCQAAALWAILSGRHRFVMLIGAVASQGSDAIVWFKKTLGENNLLLEDFPEVCYPIRKLDNEPRRCLGQRYKGVKTNMRWGKDQIVLPTIPGSVSSASTISATSLEGHIRGAWIAMPGGKVIRPTLALCDDPQTPEPLDIDTLIPTIAGFVPMGELEVDDVVFDRNGQPCRVTATSPIMYHRTCYRVTFDDGEQIIADGSHPWITSNTLQRRNMQRAKTPTGPYESTRTTEEIARTLTTLDDGRLNHSIPLAAIDVPDKELPIDPYILGLWLGNGDASSGRITVLDHEETPREIEAIGFKCGRKYFGKRNGTLRSKAASMTIIGLRKLLRINNLLKNKHIPVRYLWASRSQRLSLLQGLMDTDGHVSKSRLGVKGTRCRFTNVNPLLVVAAQHLCRTLGIKARCSISVQQEPYRAEWEVSFITDQLVFRLSRKLARLPVSVKPSVKRRFVEDIRPVASRPVRCITVDSPTHSYLCGEGFVITHNSARSQGPSGQTTYRLQVINQDVQGLAGPDAQTSILVPCTVICQGDLADQLLDRKKFPDYRGERTKRLYSWPLRKEMWERYREMREAAMQADLPLDESVEYYRKNMATCGKRMDEVRECETCPCTLECMDAGAVVDWADRMDDPRNLSAVQAAMHAFYKYGPAGFAAEFQNEPLLSETAARLPTAEEICAKANGYHRGVVPSNASHLTAFIDVGDDYLAWLVGAFAPNFTGAVIDYGTFPDQGRDFKKNAVNRPLGSVYKGNSPDSAILAGLKELTENLLARQFPQDGGGPPQQIKLCLIDTGYKPEVVHAAIRMVGKYSLVRPSRGRGITAGKTQFDDYKTDRCREIGLHWWVPKESPQGVIQIDTNWWKTFLHSRLASAAGDPGALTLFGRPMDHGLLASHILAEYYTLPSTEKGVQVQEWHQRVGRDNEWFDCLVGVMTAAARLGCSLLPMLKRPVAKRRIRPQMVDSSFRPELG